MRNHISSLMQEDGSITDEMRGSHSSPEVSQDLLMVGAVMTDTYDNPLPTTDSDPPAPLCSVPIYPDASWHLQQTAAFNFPVPTDSLLQSKGTGLVADTTTTSPWAFSSP